MASATLSVPINLAEKYILATNMQGAAWTWDYSPSGFVNKTSHAAIFSALSAGGYNAGVVYHTIDPFTAVRLGLVTVEELQPYYPEGFIALLNLLKL